MGAVFSPTRFSLVRISVRYLVPDRISYQGNLGLGVGSKVDPQVGVAKRIGWYFGWYFGGIFRYFRDVLGGVFQTEQKLRRG